MEPLLPLPQNARSALVIVDMQEFFFRTPERRRNLETVTANINRLVRHFEAQRLPIFHIVTSYRADGSDWDLKMRAADKPELIAGTPETDILPHIAVSAHHTIVTKTRYSAFFKTELAEILRKHQIHRVVVVGAYTHYCVNATVFDAYCHDFIPCVVTDATISHLGHEAELMIERMRRDGYQVLSTSECLAENSE